MSESQPQQLLYFFGSRSSDEDVIGLSRFNPNNINFKVIFNITLKLGETLLTIMCDPRKYLNINDGENYMKLITIQRRNITGLFPNPDNVTTFTYEIADNTKIYYIELLCSTENILNKNAILGGKSYRVILYNLPMPILKTREELIGLIGTFYQITPVKYYDVYFVAQTTIANMTNVNLERRVVPYDLASANSTEWLVQGNVFKSRTVSFDKINYNVLVRVVNDQIYHDQIYHLLNERFDKEIVLKGRNNNLLNLIELDAVQQFDLPTLPNIDYCVYFILGNNTIFNEKHFDFNIPLLVECHDNGNGNSTIVHSINIEDGFLTANNQRVMNTQIFEVAGNENVEYTKIDNDNIPILKSEDKKKFVVISGTSVGFFKKYINSKSIIPISDNNYLYVSPIVYNDYVGVKIANSLYLSKIKIQEPIIGIDMENKLSIGGTVIYFDSSTVFTILRPIATGYEARLSDSSNQNSETFVNINIYKYRSYSKSKTYSEQNNFFINDTTTGTDKTWYDEALKKNIIIEFKRGGELTPLYSFDVTTNIEEIEPAFKLYSYEELEQMINKEYIFFNSQLTLTESNSIKHIFVSFTDASKEYVNNIRSQGEMSGRMITSLISLIDAMNNNTLEQYISNPPINIEKPIKLNVMGNLVDSNQNNEGFCVREKALFIYESESNLTNLLKSMPNVRVISIVKDSITIPVVSMFNEGFYVNQIYIKLRNRDSWNTFLNIKTIEDFTISTEFFIPTFEACIDIKHRILTPSGYKHFNELKEGELVSQLDNKTSIIVKKEIFGNLSSYVIPKNFFEKNYPKVDTIVSDNHLVYYDNKWFHPQFSKLFKKNTVPATFYHLELMTYSHFILESGLVVESKANMNNKNLYNKRVRENPENKVNL